MEALKKKIEKFMDNYEESLKNAMSEGEKLTDQKIEALKTEMKSELDNYYEKVVKNNVSVPGLEIESERKKFSFGRACHSILNNDFSKAGYEKEVFDASHKNAVDSTSGASGGYLVPVELALEELIRPALAQTVLKEIGVTVWDDLVADVEIPEVKDRPTLSFLSEGTPVTGQNIAHGLHRMSPKTGGMLVKVGNRTLKQTSNAVDSIIKGLMQEGIALGVDKVGIIGKGTTSEPLGLFEQANLIAATALGTNGGRLKADDVAAMIADVEEEDFLKLENQGGLLVHPRVKSGLKRERVAQFSGDTGGMPLINPLMSNKVLEDTLGLKVRSTTNIPKNETKGNSSTVSRAIVGEMAQFVLGLWGGVTLKTSDQAGTAFASNQTWIVAFVDMDTMLKHPKAFSIIKDAETLESNW